MARPVHRHGRRSVDISFGAETARTTHQTGDARSAFMSIAAMNWAWRQQLAPTAKLVLMSLADAADDHGVCWPSVPTVARKCCVSSRTVRRIMQKLIACELLSAEPRYRPDGSCSSNRYRLQLGGDDKLSPAPERTDTMPCLERPGSPDTHVSPGTTRETERESSPPPITTAAVAPTVSGTAQRRGEKFSTLEYPKGLSASERTEALKRLAGLSADLAQQLLDELAGRMDAGLIKVAPLAYLRGLIRKARAGEFTPEMALRVAETRWRRQQTEATLQRLETVRNVPPPSDPSTIDNPLMQRLAAIRGKARRCSAGND